MKKRKIPVILQMEAVECGAASLAMILGYYGRYIPLEQMRVDCNITRDGSTAKYILLAAKKHGLIAKGYKLNAESLRKRTDFPVIIHWNFNHFVVLAGFEKDQAVLHDPAEGRVKVDWETFVKSFTGIVLAFSPGEDFVPIGRPGSTNHYLREGLAGMKKPVILVVMSGLIYAMIRILPPVFYKIFTDKILLGHLSEWLPALVIAMMVTISAGIISGFLQSVLLARMKAQFCIGHVSALVWKILRLPAQFFSQRFSGDIVSRVENQDEIADLLFRQMIPACMEALFLVMMMILMFCLDPWIGGIIFGIGIVEMVFMYLVSARNENAARSIARDQGKLSGAMLSGISMIETVKAAGAESGIVEKLLGYQTKYNNSMMVLQKNRLYTDLLSVLLEGISTAAVLIVGIYAIFDGRMTVGLLAAFQSFLQLFFTPLQRVGACVWAVQEIAGSVDRVQDVMAFEEAVSEEAMFAETDCAAEKLSGNVDVEHVSFSYSPVTPLLLKDFSIHVKPGEVIAISGASGSGKSTFTKLLSGLYRANSGNILFDGMPIGEIDHYVFCSSVAVVEQNISLFAGTIRDNITMWDDEIEEQTMIKACKDACIHDEIMKRRGGYDYIVREGGNDLSGGQRQRIEIARALAKNPSILILDEATSALDVITEKQVMDAVRRRGITCFIVAHRLSTIRDADEILMLKDGEIKERGTHEELMKLGGAYAALVRSD